MMKSRFWAAALCVVLFSTVLTAQEVTVPDLESKIRSSGSSISDKALPPPVLPAPAPLPKPAQPQPAPAEPIGLPAEPEQPVSPELVTPDDSSAMQHTGIRGYLFVGAGSPGTLKGVVSLERGPSSLPGFSVLFVHDTADGYAPAKPGRGFFDRSTRMDLGFNNEGEANAWRVKTSLSDSAHGLQGKSENEYSITRRSAGWEIAFRLPFKQRPFALNIAFDGMVFSAYTDRPESANASYGGYSIQPEVGLSYSVSDISLDLSAWYNYESVVRTGERMAFAANLAFAYTPSIFDIEAALGVLADSGRYVSVPFSLVFGVEPASGVFRSFRAQGGLKTQKSSPWEEGEKDPFVRLDRASVTSSDWYASASLSLRPVSSLTVSLDSLYEDTAFGKGGFDRTEETEDARILLAVKERRSVSASAGFGWIGENMSVSASWTQRFLDLLYAKYRSEFTVGYSLFDADNPDVWKLETSVKVAPGSAFLPEANASASFMPFTAFTVSLSVTDIIPLVNSRSRMRNVLYSDRSGVVMLAGRFDF